jgi:hypothetical protein
MKVNFMSLGYLNKVQTAVPLFLYEASGGSMGPEIRTALILTFLLAFLLSLIEPYYQRSQKTQESAKLALCCAFITVIVSLAELIVFKKDETLDEPIAFYGITPVILTLSIMLSFFALLCVWVDRKKMNLTRQP